MISKSNNRNVVLALLVLMALFAAALAGSGGSRDSQAENGKQANAEMVAASRIATGHNRAVSDNDDGFASLDLVAAGLGPISPYVISGGGGTNAGGSFSLEATLGEPTAANTLSGGLFTLDSGFWNVPQDFSAPSPTPSPTPTPTPGDLDTTFDSDGKLTTCCGNSPGHSVAIQSDGKIVVAGWRRNLITFLFDIWLLRYNTDGGIDASFGNNGTVTTPTVSNNNDPGRVSIALQSDGKIVVSNWASGSTGYGTYVYRYNSSGSLDTSFDNDGIANVRGVIFTDVYLAESLTIQPDGKILVAVRYHEDVINSPIVQAFGVLRFNPDGSLDPTFGNNGFAFTPSLLGNPQSQDVPLAISVQADGRIVLVGLARRSNGTTTFGVVRFNSDGTLDSGFDGDGIVTTQIGIAGDRDEAYSVGAQPDGKIVVAGFSRDNTVSESFAAVRYNSNGSLDTSFDGDGKVMTFGGFAVSNKLIIQPNGKIVIGGGNGPDFALRRFNPNGSPDGTWGTGGIITTDFGNAEFVSSMALQTDGKIVAVGSTSTNVAIARYIGDGSAPTAAPAVISGTVTTPDGAPLGGVVMTLTGSAGVRRTITDDQGFYQFADAETGGFYIVSPLRANYSFAPAERSFSLLADRTDAVFTATLVGGGFDNPLDTPEYFVRQHYLDFLGREPDESGFNFWSDQILSCGSDAACSERRTINVSAAYFLSIEFQQTGGLVDGLYRVGYGVRPNFAEFMPDTRAVAQDVVVGRDGWQAKLEANKQAFVTAFVNRPAFRTAFDSLSNEDYVATLISHTGVTFTLGERDALVSGLLTGTMTRADVLRSLADNQRFVNAKFNETFVMMEYFGYLRRDPDESGYAFCLNKLNEFNGNFEQAEMVKAFIISGEYRDRFPR